MEERKSKRQRIIFGGGVEYSEEELEKIVSFKNYVKNKDKHQFVLDFPDDTLLRFLQATSFHNDPCLKALIEYHSWQLKTLPLQITSEIENILVRTSHNIASRNPLYIRSGLQFSANYCSQRGNYFTIKNE